MERDSAENRPRQITHGPDPARTRLEQEILLLKTQVHTTEDWVVYLPAFERYVAAKFDELAESGWVPDGPNWTAEFLEGVLEPRLVEGTVAGDPVAQFRCLWNDVVKGPGRAAMHWPDQRRSAAIRLSKALSILAIDDATSPGRQSGIARRGKGGGVEPGGTEPGQNGPTARTYDSSNDERTLTSNQRQQLENAEGSLDAALEAHEKMRELPEPIRWPPPGTGNAGRSMAGEVPTLQRDIEEYVMAVLRVLADASWASGSLELFRAELEPVARLILERVLAGVNQKDLPLIDRRALENAVARETSRWTQRGQRRFLPPSMTKTLHQSAGMEENQASDRAARTDLNAPDPFQEDGSARPLGANPFPQDYPAFAAFEEATWEAKKALHNLTHELLPTNCAVQIDPIQWSLTLRLRTFSACANAALLIVGNEETAEWYEYWIDEFSRRVLRETLQTGQMKDPQAAAGCPALFTQELLPRIEVDLGLQLMRTLAHYKGEAADRVLQVKRLRDERAAESSIGDGPPSVDCVPSLLSQRDGRIHEAVGEQNFRRLTNAEIVKTSGLKRVLRDLGVAQGDATKSCLDRIRRARGYPLSRDVAKRRSDRE